MLKSSGSFPGPQCNCFHYISCYHDLWEVCKGATASLCSVSRCFSPQSGELVYGAGKIGPWLVLVMAEQEVMCRLETEVVKPRRPASVDLLFPAKPHLKSSLYSLQSSTTSYVITEKTKSLSLSLRGAFPLQTLCVTKQDESLLSLPSFCNFLPFLWVTFLFTSVDGHANYARSKPLKSGSSLTCQPLCRLRAQS